MTNILSKQLDIEGNVIEVAAPVEVVIKLTPKQEAERRYELVNEIVPLKKVGIHWFGKCPMPNCNDDGRHMALFDKCEFITCFMPKCKLVMIPVEQFLKDFELI